MPNFTQTLYAIGKMKNNSLMTLVILGVGMITYFVFTYSSIVFHDLAMSAMYQTDLGINYMIASKFIFRFLFLVIAFIVLNKSLIKQMNIEDKLEWPNFKFLGIFGLIGICLLVANMYTSTLEGNQLFQYMHRNFEDYEEFFLNYMTLDSILYLSYNIALLIFFGYFVYYLGKKRNTT